MLYCRFFGDVEHTVQSVDASRPAYPYYTPSPGSPAGLLINNLFLLSSSSSLVSGQLHQSSLVIFDQVRSTLLSANMIKNPPWPPGRSYKDPLLLLRVSLRALTPTLVASVTIAAWVSLLCHSSSSKLRDYAWKSGRRSPLSSFMTVMHRI